MCLTPPQEVLVAPASSPAAPGDGAAPSPLAAPEDAIFDAARIRWPGEDVSRARRVASGAPA